MLPRKDADSLNMDEILTPASFANSMTPDYDSGSGAGPSSIYFVEALQLSPSASAFSSIVERPRKTDPKAPRYRSKNDTLKGCINCHLRRTKCHPSTKPSVFDCRQCIHGLIICLGRPSNGQKPEWVLEANVSEVLKLTLPRLKATTESRKLGLR